MNLLANGGFESGAVAPWSAYGATIEVVQQLRGEAAGTQVENAVYGMAQNIGGSGSNIVAHILKAE